MEDVPLPNDYLQMVYNLTEEQRLECVKLFYGFVLLGGVPRNWRDYGGWGSPWYCIWNDLYNQHKRRLDMTISNTKKQMQEIMDKKLAEKDTEIARLKQIMLDQDPLEIYQRVFHMHGELHPDEAIKERLNTFRLSYKNIDGARAINTLAFKFNGKPDNRAYTSADNGKKGGRPRDPNASPCAIYQRERRAKQKMTNRT